jgi:hypothetical protein
MDRRDRLHQTSLCLLQVFNILLWAYRIHLRSTCFIAPSQSAKQQQSLWWNPTPSHAPVAVRHLRKVCAFLWVQILNSRFQWNNISILGFHRQNMSSWKETVHGRYWIHTSTICCYFLLVKKSLWKKELMWASYSLLSGQRAEHFFGFIIDIYYIQIYIYIHTSFCLKCF